MENKLILDGVEYGLSDELVAKLKEEIAINDAVRHNPGAFDRVDRKQYFFISATMGVVPRADMGDMLDDKFYLNANYCRDKELMNQRALHETLNRLLWRYSETHGGDETWYKNRPHFFIALKYPDKELFVDWTFACKTPGLVFFADRNAAQAAIEEVVKPFLEEHPEFVR